MLASLEAVERPLSDCEQKVNSGDQFSVRMTPLKLIPFSPVVLISGEILFFSTLLRKLLKSV